MVPFSSSNKRIKKMPIDGLSELPDSLLIHILSFLGVKEAGVTSVLSKRWKFLWAELPWLEFCENWENRMTLDFVSWVNRTLDVRQDYLEKFVVRFINYDECFASDVDAWIEFSVKRKVKEFSLEDMNNSYKLPEVMYSWSSLTCLNLIGCNMSYERTIEWKSLTDLCLFRVMLDQRLVDEILSSCPVLNSLKLESCWGFNRLEVNSRCLHHLTIDESEEEDQLLEISTPYLSSLNIIVFGQGRNCWLRNISSVVTAAIEFWAGGSSVEVMGYAKEFLQHFKHVNDLNIQGSCFEVVVLMAVNGWRLPQFKLRHLTIRITSYSEYEHYISGIICLLESSPNLETLLLEGHVTGREIINLEGELNGDLLHLSKIRVDNFADPNGELLLTLARILLSRAPALEEMVIIIDVKDTSDFINMAQTLLTDPRSSTKAKIVFSRK